MKKKLILLICIFTNSYSIIGQNTFMKTIGGTGDEIAQAAIKTIDNNFLVVGYTTSFGNGGEDGYVLKLDTLGEEIWSKTIGGTSNDRFLNLIQMPNGDFIITGWTESFGSGGKDILITRLDNIGNIIWTQSYGEFNDESSSTLIETSDGNLLISGWTKSNNNNNLDVLLFKLDNDGNTLWTKTYGDFGNEWLNGVGLLEDSNGNYVLAGAWTSGIGIPFHNGFILKVTPSGEDVFFQIYGGDKNDGFTGYINEVNGNIQNIGISWSWNSDNHEIWMTEMNSSGDIKWSKSFGLPNENIRIGSVFKTDENDYLISAYEFTSNTSGNGLILKVDVEGNLLWAKTFGGDLVEKILTILEFDNNIFALGFTESHGLGGKDILIIKADSLGNTPGCSDPVNLTSIDVFPSTAFPTMNIGTPSIGQNISPTVSVIDMEDSFVCMPTPTANFEISDSIICVGDCINLFNYSQNFENWEWTFTGADTLNSNVFDPSNICFSTVGTNSITLLVSNSGGIDMLTQIITVLPTPIVELGNDTTLCEGESVELNATVISAASYIWNDGSTNTTLGASDAGVYFVDVIGTCGSTSDSIKLTLVEPLVALNLGDNQDLCLGDTFILDAFQTNAQSYEWQDGTQSPEYLVNQSGTYQVTVTNECSEVSDVINIAMSDCCDLYIPNAFSPNADNNNDRFQVYFADEKCQNISSFNLKVFDRWGELVFETNDIYSSWDGKLKGKKTMNGVYAWVLNYYDGNEFISDKGDLTLIR